MIKICCIGNSHVWFFTGWQTESELLNNDMTTKDNCYRISTNGLPDEVHLNEIHINKALDKIKPIVYSSSSKTQENIKYV